MTMKWYIKDSYDIPLHWNENIMEFDTKEDAEKFAESIEKIPFLDIDICSIVQHPQCPKEYINMSGKIPVANGDDIELKEWR